MGLEFRMTIDEHARDVFGDGKFIGSIQWHPDRPPRVVWHTDKLFSITLHDLQKIVEKLDALKGLRR